MERKQLRLEGVYDQQTFSAFIQGDLSLRNFSFDMRPRSFNFFPQHRFIELIEKNFQPSCNYFLQYAYEKDFAIQKMVADIKNLFSPFNPFLQNFYLEFSDLNSCKFYEQFGVSFYWHYHWDGDLQNIINSPLLKGIIITASFLENFQNKEDLNHFFETLYHLRLKSEPKNLTFVLSLNWDTEEAKELLQSFDFDMISFPINSQVELSFRQVDLQKMGHHLNYFKDSFLP